MGSAKMFNKFRQNPHSGFPIARTTQTTVLETSNVHLSVQDLLFSSKQYNSFYPKPTHFNPADLNLSTQQLIFQGTLLRHYGVQMHHSPHNLLNRLISFTKFKCKFPYSREKVAP